MGASAAASAQTYVDIGVGVGPAPMCPYGYYDYVPYPCAPYGCYGPDWFINGVFIGTGPWYHGPVGYRGYGGPRYAVPRGYARAFPQRGGRPGPAAHFSRAPRFHGG